MTEKEIEKMERVREMLNKHRPKEPCEEYRSDLLKYLTSKLQPYDIPQCTLMEIAQYAAMGALWVANTEVKRAVRSMKGRPIKWPKEGAENE